MLDARVHSPDFEVRGEPFSVNEVLGVLSPYVSERRRARIEQVVAGRTFAVVPVLEGLHDRGNVSAVLRSAEAMGLQRVHIIELLKRFKKANRVTQGAEKWLDLVRWDTTAACLDFLKRQGYRILATCMEGAEPIDAVAFHHPTALVFGNECEGVTPEVLARCDARVAIPMHGFTQSFNISVAAALSFYHIRQDRLRRLGHHGDLSSAARRRLTASYYLRSVGNAEQLLLRARRDAEETAD